MAKVSKILISSILAILITTFTYSLSHADEASPFSITDAQARGSFNNGPAEGRERSVFDETLGKNVLELDYSASRGSAVGIWTEDFPSALTSSAVNAVRIGVKVPTTDQLRQLSVNVEIKGTKGIQAIPVELETAGWNSVQNPIQWKRIGELKEIAFVVAPRVSDETAEGKLYFDLEFAQLSPAQLVTTKTPKEIKNYFTLVDAGMEDVFNIGLSLGGVNRVPDKALGRDVLRFDYSLPQGAIIGVWTKNYPAELGSKAVDAIKANVMVSHPEQLKQVSVTLEIKGLTSTQRIPLNLAAPGWNATRSLIDWNKIGALQEIVFVVNPKVVSPEGTNPMWFGPSEEEAPVKETKPADGILHFDLEFYKLSFLQKNFIFIKIGIVFLMSLVIGWIIAVFSKFFTRRAVVGKPGEATGLGRLKRDLFYGVMAVLIAGVALSIYSIGTVSTLEAGFNFSFVIIALMGAVIAEVFKYKFTGKHLTPAETLQNILVTGLLAAGSSMLGALQGPSDWAQLLMLNKIIATVAFLVYHIYNISSLTSSGKHVNVLTGALVIGVPYAFNWLLILQNAALLQTLGKIVTFGMLKDSPAILEVLGRILVVFVFNEAFISAISFVTSGKLLKSIKAHIFVLFVSLGVVIAPLVADMGSTGAISALPVALKIAVYMITSMLAFAGLWGEVYLITGMALDSGHRRAPSWDSISSHVKMGMRKGMAYSGIFMGILFALQLLLYAQAWKAVIAFLPLVVGTVGGALIFPFVKTIVETFDGSLPFFQRVRHSYKDATLLARGAIAGFGFAYAITNNYAEQLMSHRILFGLIIGVLASSGVSILRDIVYSIKGQGKIQTWRLYFTDGLLGAFLGGALAFYLDSLQIPVIVEKFKLYTSSGFPAKDYVRYLLVNRWGRVDLGVYTGGPKLLFIESLAGVLYWSIAAWLFAINKVLLLAIFEKHTAPIKFFFSKAGFAQLTEHMIYVLRWGLWMAPIIFTFLRMMPEPTWYNQDGGVRTIFAIGHGLTMSPAGFKQWSLNLYTYIMAFGWLQVLVWMDHMGLRVATLVNLSFIGLDRVDEKVARFIGPAAAQRYIPEAVKRFATWGPLLIPFYLPRGKDWDHVWDTAQSLKSSQGGGLIQALRSLSTFEKIAVAAAAIALFTGVSFVFRMFRARGERKRMKQHELQNRKYKVVLKENGEIYSEVFHKKAGVFPDEYDVSRRSYDHIDPSGRTLYLVDTSKEEKDKKRSWPVMGNFPKELFTKSIIQKEDDSLKATNTSNDIKTTINISLPHEYTPVEIWTITVENLSHNVRNLKVVPYLEWVLNGGLHDRFHTQYARLFPEMEYAERGNAILSWQKSTKSMGILAVDVPPEGFLTSRMDFIGRAQSIWKPRVLETLDFMPAKKDSPYPTFDPIGSLMVDATINPRGFKTIRVMIGYAKDKKGALKLVSKYLKPLPYKAVSMPREKKKTMLIGHGEILPETPQPYSSYSEDGNRFLVHTPFTTRPYDHAMSNALGHSVMVTNRGLHTTCSSNSQQNRLTPDWPDTVTKEVPVEAIYLYDPDKNEWFSPTYHPLNDQSAKNESEFSVDGTATFHMTKGDLSTELTVFVPSDEKLGVYFLKVKNNSDRLKRVRVAPFFEMSLDFQPEKAGELEMRHDKETNSLLFRNPRNMFHVGWAFASMSKKADCVETKRGKFFGKGRGIQHPFMVEKGKSDLSSLVDAKQIAAFLGTLEIPARGEEKVAVVLGQTENYKESLGLVKKYKDIGTVEKRLADTRSWWTSLMETMVVKTNSSEFDHYQNWLKYQAIAERIWARRGFYQTSGAYGFRDQLQDSINLLFVDPKLARKQIILHASHQFLEGDVYHWFFTRSDGRTAFACRSHASDNPAWLPWAVVEYVRATGDHTILDERASYVWSEFPFADLPKNKTGWGHLYHRSPREESLYKHCLRSIDLIFNKRLGKHGLPLIRTGDWNDGLDEIGSEGKGESVWLGFFLYYIMKDMIHIIEKKDGPNRKAHYQKKMERLARAIESTWREDRYLRAFHDDGTEIGIKGSGVWEIDALTVAWAVMCGINPERELKVFNTALEILEKDNAVLLGWPALREDTKPYLGRSSKYPEGVRENGMYCHGVQWLIKAARILAERFEKAGDETGAAKYREIAYRLWLKITPLSHVTPDQIEIYGGQPNKQPADILTNFDRGRMIWNGYTGAAGWLFREAMEGVVGARLESGKLILPGDLDKSRGTLKVASVSRNVEKSPL
ncbi:GH36-type glycosyl hydrolase domain-containing protein [Candidatus Omnitrophota bacterium]